MGGAGRGHRLGDIGVVVMTHADSLRMGAGRLIPAPARLASTRPVILATVTAVQVSRRRFARRLEKPGLARAMALISWLSA